MHVVTLLILVILAMSLGGYLAVRSLYAVIQQLLGTSDSDPVERAHRIAERVYRQLEAATGSREIYGEALKQINDIIESKLPRLSETQSRLTAYLKEKPRSTLEREIEFLKKELEASNDPDVRRLVEKNIKLAVERLDTHSRIAILRERTLAQIKNVLLTLESLEDRVVSLKLAETEPDVVLQLENTVGDVNQLEVELKKLRLLE